MEETKGNIKDSLMGHSVLSHESRTIHGKNHMEILNANIMQNLVISSLQKGGINRHHRL